MQPTRVTATSSTLIDHIYTNNEDNILSVRVPKPCICDHKSQKSRILQHKSILNKKETVNVYSMQDFS